MKKKDIISLFILFGVIAFAGYRFYNRFHSYEDSRFLMDTIVTLKLEDDNCELESVADSAFSLIRNLDDKLSFYGSGLISDINNSNISEFNMDNDLYQLLLISQQLYETTRGKYDVTIGTVSELWNFNTGKIPAPDSIAAHLKIVGFDKLEFNKKNLYKPNGMKLNLGSLAKGYIVDKIVDFLKKNNIERGIVNAGGDMRLFGYSHKMPIGIQHPRNRNEIIATLDIKNKAIVTSGDYERFFIKDKKRYHHILDATTGYPSHQAISVTVLANKAVWADALSTAIFLLPPKKGIEIINSLPNTEAIIYYEKEGEIWSHQVNTEIEAANPPTSRSTNEIHSSP
ncbi:MAG: FAD:protein FMN transferase, partial [Candidatus Cloacimonadota bacterium]|nr:FAD:protein FMN transferase [Candidatus Cloacimonadota bacterium]